MIRKLLTIAVASALIAGCGPKYSCLETVEGVKCGNISQVYDQKVTGESAPGNSAVVPNQKTEKQGRVVSHKTTEPELIVRNLDSDESRPIRLPPIILRIWTAPWEDSDGDLHKPGYIYTEIDQRRGRWLFGETEASSVSSLRNPVYSSSPSGLGQKKPEQKQKGAKKESGTPPEKFYGQTPDPNVPKLKLSR